MIYFRVIFVLETLLCHGILSQFSSLTIYFRKVNARRIFTRILHLARPWQLLTVKVTYAKTCLNVCKCVPIDPTGYTSYLLPYIYFDTPTCASNKRIKVHSVDKLTALAWTRKMLRHSSAHFSLCPISFELVRSVHARCIHISLMY